MLEKIFTRPGSEAGFELPPNWYDKGGLEGWRAAQRGQLETPRIRKPSDDKQIQDLMGSWDPEINKLITQCGRNKKGEPSFLFPDGSQLITHGFYNANGSYNLTSITMQCAGKDAGRGIVLAAELAGWNLDSIRFEGSPKGIIKAKAALQKEHDRRQQVVLEGMSAWFETKLRDSVDISVQLGNIEALKKRNTPEDIKEAYARQQLVDTAMGGVGLSNGKPSSLAEHKAKLLEAIQEKLSKSSVPLSVVTKILHENVGKLKPTGKEPDFQEIAKLLGINIPWVAAGPAPVAGPTLNQNPQTPVVPVGVINITHTTRTNPAPQTVRAMQPQPGMKQLN